MSPEEVLEAAFKKINEWDDDATEIRSLVNPKDKIARWGLLKKEINAFFVQLKKAFDIASQEYKDALDKETGIGKEIEEAVQITGLKKLDTTGAGFMVARKKAASFSHLRRDYDKAVAKCSALRTRKDGLEGQIIRIREYMNDIDREIESEVKSVLTLADAAQAGKLKRP